MSELSDLTPLAGGWSGRTFLAEAAGERTVVRIYPAGDRRGPTAPEVDAAVLRLVRGLVPVPDVLEVRRGDAATDRPGLLVTTFVAGVRGDELLPTLDDDGLATLGRHLGSLLADLAGMPQPRSGWFADGDLTLRPFAELGLPDDLPAFLDTLSLPGVPLDRLRPLVADAQDLLDTVGRTCLVHSDLNPKNLLVDPTTLEVAALLDWEYAHAGHPFTDLGNLLRFDDRPAFASAVLAAFTERRGGTPDDALALARAADWWALLELASRAGDNPVADRALARVRHLADAS